MFQELLKDIFDCFEKFSQLLEFNFCKLTIQNNILTTVVN